MGYGRIFLVFSDTGGGHRSAAEAIKQAILEVSLQRGDGLPEVVMQDMIEESNLVNRVFTHTYNKLLKNHQDWMKYYFALIEYLKPNESEFGYQITKGYAKKVIIDLHPTVIVSVHPMVNHFLARSLKDLGLSKKIKLITVLTDPNANLWTGWACPDADLTIAPNDLARDRLISFGLDPAAVKVIGMPIQPGFLRPPSESRRSLLSGLGLNPNQLTVAITAGSAGGGNVAKIYRVLEKVHKPVQVIFMCGKNKKLKGKIERAAENSPIKTVVIPYATSMVDTMNACDLLVTKAGGLTTFEAIASRLPMALDMLTEPMPQETGTAQMLIEAGLAKPIRKAEDIIPIIEALEINHQRRNMPLPAVHNLDRVSAVYEIAELILTFCQPTHGMISDPDGDAISAIH